MFLSGGWKRLPPDSSSYCVLRNVLVTGPLQIWYLHPWSYFEWSCMHNYDHSFLLTAVNCDVLTDPANGQVSHNTGTTLHQTATYSCNTGYDLVGDRTRTCQATGQWSGSTPTCHRMLFLHPTCMHVYSGQWGKYFLKVLLILQKGDFIHTKQCIWALYTEHTNIWRNMTVQEL